MHSARGLSPGLVFPRAAGGDLFDVSLGHTNLLSQEPGTVEKGLGISWCSRVYFSVKYSNLILASLGNALIFKDEC